MVCVTNVVPCLGERPDSKVNYKKPANQTKLAWEKRTHTHTVSLYKAKEASFYALLAKVKFYKANNRENFVSCQFEGVFFLTEKVSCRA